MFVFAVGSIQMGIIFPVGLDEGRIPFIYKAAARQINIRLRYIGFKFYPDLVFSNLGKFAVVYGFGIAHKNNFTHYLSP